MAKNEIRATLPFIKKLLENIKTNRTEHWCNGNDLLAAAHQQVTDLLCHWVDALTAAITLPVSFPFIPQVKPLMNK